MIAIVGASGFIGRHLLSFLREKHEAVVGTYYHTPCRDCVQFDLRADDFSLFDRCSHVIICGGITRIDECFVRKEDAYLINAERTIALIDSLAQREIIPVFLSSDQVFDGTKGNYREEDTPAPVNQYGTTKVIVEEYLRNKVKEYLILRLSKIHADASEQGNYAAEIVSALRQHKAVKAAYDRIYNPTEISWACAGIYEAIRHDLRGIFHCAQTMAMSHYEFARMIAQRYGCDSALVEAVEFGSFPILEKRALNSSLNVEKITEAIGVINA